MNSGDRTGRDRREAARAFDAAMRESGTKNSALGVDESRVRRWRSDDAADLEAAPPTSALIGCSWEMFEAWVARVRAARSEIHGASTVQSVEALMFGALVADSDVQRVFCGALADGSVDPPEVPAALDALARSDAKRAELAAALRKRGAR